MKLHDFHQEIQRVFIDSFDEWEKWNISNEPGDQDKFEDIALNCASKVVDIALGVKRPPPPRTKVTWEEAKPVIEQFNKMFKPLGVRIQVDVGIDRIIGLHLLQTVEGLG
jgi:hypothetical protein